MSQTVRSRDGTIIAYDQAGSGPAVILIDGALSARGGSLNEPLAAELSPHFTVITYDRRGRGGSGDTAPYAVDREVEDIDALINVLGGSAMLYGLSSGAVLALEAAQQLGDKVTRLAIFEAPFVVDGTRAPVPAGYQARLAQLSTSNRGAAVDFFMKEGIGLPGWMVLLMRLLPSRKAQKALAHTLTYDAAVMGTTQSGEPLLAERWNRVNTPTLVIAGGKSPAWMKNAQLALAAVLPAAEHRVLPGQMHIVNAKVLAPMLAAFLGGEAAPHVS